MPGKTNCTVHEITWHGLPALALANGAVGQDAIELVMVPGWGAKIASLRSGSSGREWLSSNPHLEIRLPRYGASYVQEYDAGGWDECFPSVSAGNYPAYPWQDTYLPDHGEVWSLPWEIKWEQQTPSVLHLKASTSGVHFPYNFARSLEMRQDEPGFRLNYRVTNYAAFPFLCLWSCHPLLRIAAGMRLELPPGAEIRPNAPIPDVIGHWPMANLGNGEEDISLIPGPEAGVARKLFVGPLPCENTRLGYAILRDNHSGEALTMRFDPRQIPYVGLWQNYGGWSQVPGAPPYYNLGLEPCLGCPDALRQAMAWGSIAVVPPKGVISWQLQVEISRT
ncbi:MAG: hypothetical protein EXR62_06745 [Chloroflexi bacterium]|nr:hypothetical protein [Chloroflexota bacterium]